MFGLRVPELLLILAVVLVLFGSSKLPQLGSAIGETIKGFKKSMKEGQEDDEAATTKALPRNETVPQQGAASKTGANAK